MILGNSISPAMLHRIGLATLVVAQLFWLAIDQAGLRTAPLAHAALGLLYGISIACMLLAVLRRRRAANGGARCA